MGKDVSSAREKKQKYALRYILLILVLIFSTVVLLGVSNRHPAIQATPAASHSTPTPSLLEVHEYAHSIRGACSTHPSGRAPSVGFQVLQAMCVTRLLCHCLPPAGSSNRQPNWKSRHGSSCLTTLGCSNRIAALDRLTLNTRPWSRDMGPQTYLIYRVDGKAYQAKPE